MGPPEGREALGATEAAAEAFPGDLQPRRLARTSAVSGTYNRLSVRFLRIAPCLLGDRDRVGNRANHLKNFVLVQRNERLPIRVVLELAGGIWRVG